jgi:hypothetical protein
MDDYVTHTEDFRSHNKIFPFELTAAKSVDEKGDQAMSVTEF